MTYPCLKNKFHSLKFILPCSCRPWHFVCTVYFNDYATCIRKNINCYPKRPPSHIGITGVENINHYLTVYRLRVIKLKQHKASMLQPSVRRVRGNKIRIIFSFVGTCIKFPVSGTFLLAEFVISGSLLL